VFEAERVAQAAEGLWSARCPRRPLSAVQLTLRTLNLHHTFQLTQHTSNSLVVVPVPLHPNLRTAHHAGSHALWLKSDPSFLTENQPTELFLYQQSEC
jgi:hypothetical protein